MNKNVITRLLIICYLVLTTLYINLPNVFNKIQCPFYALTHIPCAGCGATRAVKSLYERNIIDAVKYNLLAVISLPILIISLFSDKLLNLFETKLLSITTICTVATFFLLRLFGNILHANIPIIGFKN